MKSDQHASAITCEVSSSCFRRLYSLIARSCELEEEHGPLCKNVGFIACYIFSSCRKCAKTDKWLTQKLKTQRGKSLCLPEYIWP